MSANEKRKDHELAALHGVVDRCGIVISEKRATDFATRDIEGDIKRLLGKDTEAPTLRIPSPDIINSSTIRFACCNGCISSTHQIPWRSLPYNESDNS